MGKSKHADKHPLLSAIAGGITGAIEISITFPTEYLKTVMQLYPEMNKKGTIGVIKETFSSRGLFGKNKSNMFNLKDFTEDIPLCYFFQYQKTM
jgi:hypothetical protein